MPKVVQEMWVHKVQRDRRDQLETQVHKVRWDHKERQVHKVQRELKEPQER